MNEDDINLPVVHMASTVEQVYVTHAISICIARQLQLYTLQDRNQLSSSNVCNAIIHPYPREHLLYSRLITITFSDTQLDAGSKPTD